MVNTKLEWLKIDTLENGFIGFSAVFAIASDREVIWWRFVLFLEKNLGVPKIPAHDRYKLHCVRKPSEQLTGECRRCMDVQGITTFSLILVWFILMGRK